MKNAARYTVEVEWGDEFYSVVGWVSTDQEMYGSDADGNRGVLTTFCDVNLEEVWLLSGEEGERVREIPRLDYFGTLWSYRMRDALEETHHTAVSEGAFEPDPDTAYDTWREM